MKLTADFRISRGDFRARYLAEGEFDVCLVHGISGAGKTTFAETLLGLVVAEEGHAKLDEAPLFDSTTAAPDLVGSARGIGYAPQDDLLFPHLTAVQNVHFFARYRRSPAPLDLVSAALELAALSGRKVSTLSGGERKRVAIARALAGSERLAILDEPFGALNSELQGKLTSLLDELAVDYGLPSIVISHQRAHFSRARLWEFEIAAKVS